MIGGGLGLWDRFIPPAVEPVEVLPVYVWSVEKAMVDNREIKSLKRGFSIIVRLRSKGRITIITGLDISGKQRMTLDEWTAFDGKNSESLKDIEARYIQRKPFYRISWTGWMEDSRVPIKLEAHEERYIRFTVVEPHIGAGGRTMDGRYIGFDDGSRTPQAVRYHAEAWDFFIHGTSSEGFGWEPHGISNEIKDGEIRFYLRVGASTILIPPHMFRSLKKVRQKDWNEKSVENLFHDRDL